MDICTITISIRRKWWAKPLYGVFMLMAALNLPGAGRLGWFVINRGTRYTTT